MKLKLLTASTIIITMIACNQTSKKDNQNSGETTVKQEQVIDISATIAKDSGVYFVNLKDGEKVKSPLFIEMGIKGMEVEPAGKIDEGKGHHHLIIDGSYTEKGQIVPKDATHLHFGKGQTSDTLQLNPGNHTLTLQFANGAHESYGQNWSKTITINVVK